CARPNDHEGFDYW
nr:immunoglobulin heavy chain junction region [Macaca mulatta]MOV38392.1 immunoglobulin heavy chain junction region [Macaca mulatta]MOV39575.1 immunoglobulin heavy chain junction region [Macaca mulatta]MOV41186.1 immunoglobulin heavy chain junction region [Macaca mulatta]MOV42421.1 immunoglobulin heavy chain junction region [Macaca mulatta]